MRIWRELIVGFLMIGMMTGLWKAALVAAQPSASRWMAIPFVLASCGCWYLASCVATDGDGL